MNRARFAQVMAGDAESLPLDEAALAISAALQPGLDEIEWLAALDLLAGQCPTPTAEGVARHLFDHAGFTGNRHAYYDWRNSCLDRVIASRQGIPITLSVLMIEVARRVGVKLLGVGMPAHFLVRVADDDAMFFDPFAGSVPLDRGDVGSLFTRITDGRAPWSDAYLTPIPNRDIVVRMLNNLKAVFAARGDLVRLATVLELRAQLPEFAEVEHTELLAATAVFN